MQAVLWAALAIGGSTLLGTGCGLFSHVTETWNDAVTAFAAGVMLAAAVFGLFQPAMDMTDGLGFLLIIGGAACGVLFLRAISYISGRISGGAGMLHLHPELMFVLAIAVHKFPEGMAGGVGLSGMDPAAAFTVAAGIAIQNLPEGVVMIPPLLNAGVSRGKTACIAIATGLLNAAGVFAGALWGCLPGAVMPFALAFAGGAMLDVIVAQMIPQVACSAGLRDGSRIVLGGFLIMASVNILF